MGLPVVTTDVAGTKELVIDGQTGFVVPQGDVASGAMPYLTWWMMNSSATHGPGGSAACRTGVFLHQAVAAHRTYL